MSQAFLSNLALHISLHPSCRTELRRHWPAPHFHKAPHNALKEAGEQLRCQAAGTSSAASLTAAVRGGHGGSRKGGGVREFNPYETFSLRLQRKRKAPVKSGCRSHGSNAAPQQRQQTTTEVPKSKAKRRMSTSSPRVGSASSTARVGSASASIASSSPRTRASRLSGPSAAAVTPTTTVDAKAKGAASAKLAAGASTAAPKKHKSPRAAAASPFAPDSSAVKVTAAASPSHSCLAKASLELRPGGEAKSSSPPLSSAAAAAATAITSKRTVAVNVTRKESDTAPTSVADDSASVTPAKPKKSREGGKPALGDANDTKQKMPRSTAVAAGGSSSIGPAASKKKKAAGNSSSSKGGCAAGSDSGSEIESVVRDPLKIRLPCNLPCRGKPGERNGHHPVHVTVRWSGARQRRRRFFAQHPVLTRPESAMPLPQSSCLAKLSLGSDGREVRVGAVTPEDETCCGASEKEQSKGFAPPWAPGSADGLDAAMTAGRLAQHPPGTVDDASLFNRAPLARHFARHPAQKSSTILSQSTATAARTSALGVSGSDLPTPSSVDHFSAPPHSALPPPNSLFIIRSPAQDYADETAASGPCYGFAQVSVPTNVSSPLAIAGPVGARSFRGPSGGVAPASSLNHPRVTYVADTMLSNTQAHSTQYHSLLLSIDRASSPHPPSSLAPAHPSAPSCANQLPHQSQQQGGSLHGLTCIQQPNALMMSGRKLSDPMVSGHVWSNLDSPTQVNSATLRSGGGDGGSVHARALFSAVQSPLLSLSSTPLCLTPLSTHACGAAAAVATAGSTSAAVAPGPMVRSAHRSSTDTSARGGQEVSTPLHGKTMMPQRCRSFLVRRQQQRHACASAAHADLFGPPPVHAASNLSCDDTPPPHEQPQQSLILSTPLPPLAPQLLDTVPGGVRLPGVRRVTSARRRASAGDAADDDPRSLGGRDGTLYHHTSANAPHPSSHLPFVSSAAIAGLGESFQSPKLRFDRPQHIEAVPTIQLSGEWSPHILVAGEGSSNWSFASSLQLTQQYLPSSVQLMRGDGGTELQGKSPRPWAYTQTRLYAPSESTAWLENNGLTTVTATPAMSPMLGHYASYFGNSSNPIFSEPVTPLCWSPQRYSSGLARAHQQASSGSLTSTSFLSHQLVPTSSFGTIGSALQQGVRRTPPGLVRVPSFSASAATPAAAAPQVFCKYQRSEHQRRRRRLPLPLPGTRCPGMADRLAFDAYRAAVRKGVIAEEEDCSYYLSHHRCTSSSPMPSPHPSTQPHRSTARQSSPSSPTACSPLCVVSLADCHIHSPPAATLTSAAGHRSNARARWDDRREESEEAMAEREETAFGTPSCLYHIPLCCDDVYHRDEEALEMLSVTTTSSCAFGAGLDGLCWQDWMPSSPVEAGEAMLRAAEQAAATAARATASSHARDLSCLSTIVNNSPGSQDALCTGLPVPLAAASVTTMGDSCATGSVTLAAFGVPSSSKGTSSRQAAVVCASGGTVTSAGISAPRNSEDLSHLSCRALDDAAACGVDEDATDLVATSSVNCSDGDGRQSQRLVPRQNLRTTDAPSDSDNHPNLSGSGKRPFIAEWIVSKLQKHMEKKKQKKQRKQLKREAAAVEAAATASKGRATPKAGNPREPRPPKAGSKPLPSHDGAPQARSRTSSVSEHSDGRCTRGGSLAPSLKGSAGRRLPCLSMAMPTAADATKQHNRQRVAYLAAAYQTELLIHEQKRREAEANRRGLEELVHRSRAKLTPAAAAASAGYCYEGRVMASMGFSRPPAQTRNEPFGTLPLKPTRIGAAVAAAAIDAGGDGSSSGGGSAATYRSGFSNGSEKTGNAVVVKSVVSFGSRRVPAQGEVTPPRPTLTRTSRAGKKLSNVPSKKRGGTAEGTTEAATLKPIDGAALQEQPPSELDRRTSKTLAMMSMAEAERRRVALDALKKKQAIENWMFGLRS
ncbi:hypothetical protein GH5_06944 [Leishmania sp. Ghana 2012 LV757]|uniref:hypothetical protein n=1 Tax=Leishmania sp. Ghana 2012 LV757 TaxID=2803181 RepID=UPI001B72E668|nr:hypothetical protein GH5_06944 [Leishmania sp. Ghana 2012 LV757]